MERTIKVTGNGKISIKPDTTVIVLDFSQVLPTYEEAVRAASRDVVHVKDMLEKLSLDRETLKTTDFEVKMHYRYEYDKKNNRKSIFDGYQYKQGLKFTFPINNELLGKVLFQISKLASNPELNFWFTTSNKEKYRNELLALAVKDAKEKARVIAEAAEVELEHVLDINYNYYSDDYNTRSYLRNEIMYCKAASVEDHYDIDIEPEDIDKSTSVSVVYTIK